MKPGYVPDSGDIVWLHLDPQAGHEQSGYRPALVLSPARYNGPRGMMIYCPMTSRIKGYPFEVVDEDDPPSAVLVDQVKSMDWRAGRAEKQGRVSSATLAEVRAKIRALLELLRAEAVNACFLPRSRGNRSSRDVSRPLPLAINRTG